MAFILLAWRVTQNGTGFGLGKLNAVGFDEGFLNNGNLAGEELVGGFLDGIPTIEGQNSTIAHVSVNGSKQNCR